MSAAQGNAVIDIPAGEHDILRLFAIDLPREAMRDMLTSFDGGETTPSLVAQLLGVPALDARYGELFDAADLAGLGLSGYLREGYDLAPETLDKDAARLDAIKGYVLLLLSQAFARKATRLTPMRSLRLVASYPLPGADNSMTRFTPPGTRARIGAATGPSGPSRTRTPWKLWLLPILAFAAILLWLFLAL